MTIKEANDFLNKPMVKNRRIFQNKVISAYFDCTTTLVIYPWYEKNQITIITYETYQYHDNRDNSIIETGCEAQSTECNLFYQDKLDDHFINICEDIKSSRNFLEITKEVQNENIQ